MKSSEIHNGLEKSEIRDFLSIGLLKLDKEENENKKESSNYNREVVLDWCIRDAEAQIKYLKKYIEINRGRQAIITLIKMNDWEEFDVSDETENDLKYNQWMSFIGTEEEHKELLKSIKDKK